MKYLLTHFPRNSLVLGTVPSTDFTCKSRFIQAETMENILKDCADKIISVANTIGSVTGSAKMAETLCRDTTRYRGKKKLSWDEKLCLI